MYTDNRNAYRKIFFDTWEKHSKKLPLEKMEEQVLAVMLTHPEYQKLLSQPKQYMEQEFALEENPFFHMSLHIALHEQIHLDRPSGIRKIAQDLSQQHTPHDAEHMIITVMARILYAAQQSGQAPDEAEYLRELQNLLP